MRRKRVTAENGYYHVVSRIAGKEFRLEGEEGKKLLEIIRRAAAFSGVQVFTYAMMSSHFHLLVRVPERREVDDAELGRRLAALFGKGGYGKIAARWADWREKGREGRIEEEKRRFRARMYDLSQFVKTFKETFSKGYNARHKWTGSIWEGRFKSVLVEASHEALMSVAGYIHLNPVRAKMAGTAEEAANTGYGLACAGRLEEQRGLMALLARIVEQPVTWAQAKAAFAEAVEGVGEEEEREGETMTLSGLLGKRRAAFTSGGAVGGRAFAERVAKRAGRKYRRVAGALDRAEHLGLAAAFGTRE